MDTFTITITKDQLLALQDALHNRIDDFSPKANAKSQRFYKLMEETQSCISTQMQLQQLEDEIDFCPPERRALLDRAIENARLSIADYLNQSILK